MSDASEEESAGNVSAGTAATVAVAVTVAAAAKSPTTLAPLDQPLNLCVAKKSRDSNASSPMPAAKLNLAKTGGKKGKQMPNIIN